MQVIRRIDNRLNLNNSRTFETTQGCSHISFVEYPNQNATIGSVIALNCNPPNRNIAVVRKVLKKIRYTITITGNTTTAQLLQDGAHGPAQFPNIQITQNEAITLGQTTISQSNVNETWKAMLRYNNETNINNYIYSTAPSMLDNCQQFSDLIGTNKNVLSNEYGDNAFQTSRGAFYNYTVLSNTPTQAVVSFESTEPLFCSPFVFGSQANMTPAFVGIETMSYNCTFGNKNLAFNCDLTQNGTGNITGIDTQINYFSLGFEYLTAQISMDIPRSLVCSYYEPYVVSVATGVPLVAGASVVMPQLRTQLSGIPKRIFMWCADASSNTSSFNPSTFLSLQDIVGCVKIRINGQPSLESHNRQAIYEICRNNGINYDYSQFSKYIGSVVCVDYASNIGQDINQSEGLAQMNEWQSEIAVVNTSNRTIQNPTFYCVFIYSGLFEVNNGQTRHSINPLSQADIAKAPLNMAHKSPNAMPNDVYGGSLWGSLQNMFSGAKDFAKKSGILSKGARLSGNDDYADALSALGYGVSGGGLSGGRVMSRNRLLEMGNRF
jgi:hypothetical protein